MITIIYYYYYYMVISEWNFHERDSPKSHSTKSGCYIQSRLASLYCVGFCVTLIDLVHGISACRV